MSLKPVSLDEFIGLLGKTDLRQRQNLADALVAYLADDNNSLECEDLGLLVDGLLPWLDGGNFKIAQSTLEVFNELIGRLGSDFSAYAATVLTHIIDRLGDSRETVREKALIVLQKLTECQVFSAQVLLSKLIPYFKHKNAKLREEVLRCVVLTLNEHGSQALSLKTFIPCIMSLLSDPNSAVRDASINTLVEIYKHVGERLRVDLRKKDIPAPKLALLENRFDEARNLGLLLPSAMVGPADEPDNLVMQRPAKPVKRAASMPLKKGINNQAETPGEAGSVSVEIFENSFENVPRINLFSPRDLDDHIKVIKSVIGDKDMAWEKRVDALRKIRSLLLADVMTYPSFMMYIKDLSISFLLIIKELRSQVIRETCITIAYMSKVIGIKLDQFCAYILNDLIVTLIPNAAKVISSAGTLTIRYIIRYVHSPKLIQPIVQNIIVSKSKDVRSTLCDILSELLEQWSTNCLEKNVLPIRDAIKKGIADADPDARKYSRKSFWQFKRHYPDIADAMYNTLDITQQKALDREHSGSATSSIRGSNGFLHSLGAERRSSQGLKSPVSTHITDSRAIGGFRSVSAVDTAAAQRAKARLQYSNMARMKVTSGTASLPRARKQTTPNTRVMQQSPERSARTRGPGVSHSQPTSRSTSPSSRLHGAYGTYSNHKSLTSAKKKSSGIPRSLASSRETSPTRTGSYRRMLFNNKRDRPPINPNKPVMAQKILQQSREAELSLADALMDDQDPLDEMSRLSLGNRRISSGANTGMMRDDHSDDSENSSVCSERSFSSLHGPMDSYSWSGSQSKLGVQDIPQIIANCASTNVKDRYIGLRHLIQYFKDGNTLELPELQIITDMFSKLFTDSQIKVYTLFIDTVNELLITHANDLHDWLYILLTRLFNKLGTDILGSICNRIMKTLEIINEYFPTNLQMKCVFRFLSNNAQTPNTKTKIATLKFLKTLTTSYDVSNNFYYQEPASKALLKIINFSSDPKSSELRTEAKYCLVAIYNCNTVKTTMLINELPNQSRDVAMNIIQNYIKRPGGFDSPHSPSSCVSPKLLQSPVQAYYLPGTSIGRTSRLSSADSESMNQEEIYKNIYKTTAEIQNYSFETSGYSKLGKDTTSKDSGISQMSNAEMIPAPNGLNGHGTDESSNGSKTQSADTSESGTPEIQLESQSNSTNILQSRLQNGHKERDIIDAAIKLSKDDPQNLKEETLDELYFVIRNGNCQLVIENFKAILRTLVDIIGNTQEVQNAIRAQHVIVSIFRRAEMKPCWINYIELLLLKIINNYKETKEIARDADFALTHIAKVLPVDLAIQVVHPIIATGEYPLNLGAVKLLTELTKQHQEEITEQHLEMVMSSLATLTDHSASAMRKATVFCIVELHLALGDERISPYLQHLSASKKRLLNVYIEKNKTTKKSS
ncbi:CLIP-associating protein isoform X3 [Ctenocephalides felis]|uniref:CLIP-associating protein isoform X3 n=1 Tax=Ctenocephalides felis TaxID=7515 RepID=UPI000E6E139B|nr:CLIP-associating protein isoform X3 [Ctenocephalides felis]